MFSFGHGTFNSEPSPYNEGKANLQKSSRIIEAQDPHINRGSCMGRIQRGMRLLSPATKNIPNLKIQRGKNHSAPNINSHANSGQPIVSVRECVNPFRRKICASHKLFSFETKLFLRHQRLVQRPSKRDATSYQRGIKTSSRKYTSSDVKRSLCGH